MNFRLLKYILFNNIFAKFHNFLLHNLFKYHLLGNEISSKLVKYYLIWSIGKLEIFLTVFLHT